MTLSNRLFNVKSFIFDLLSTDFLVLLFNLLKGPFTTLYSTSPFYSKASLTQPSLIQPTYDISYVSDRTRQP